MDIPTLLALGAVAVSLVSVGFTFARRKNQVVSGLRDELDQALSENRRLASERAELESQLRAARIKATKAETLAAHAEMAVAYAEQIGGTSRQKLAHALAASIRFDKDANGRQDWSDAQHRIAIEAALARRAKQ